MTRIDPYSASLREEQKAILNGLLGLIYDNYDTTKRIENTVNSIYRIVIAMLVIIVLLVVGILLFVCYVICRKYQNERLARNVSDTEVQECFCFDVTRWGIRHAREAERASPMHQPRKSAPIEI